MSRRLDGAARTCVWYACVPYRRGGNWYGNTVCSADFALRCIEYSDQSAMAPYVGQRKTWPEYIHAATSPTQTRRATYPPNRSKQGRLKQLKARRPVERRR